jgi:hypothetical protein
VLRKGAAVRVRFAAETPEGKTNMTQSLKLKNVPSGFVTKSEKALVGPANPKIIRWQKNTERKC